MHPQRLPGFHATKEYQMIRTRMLVAAVTTVAFANVAAFANFATTAISRPLATINHHARLPSVGAPRPNANSVSEIAGDPLDNAREGDGTIYGYRV
ncbi:MAG: hypothetical protein CL858_14690 [Cupriavidus sp.]|nr:hypothetical protein [Cupriavidus sp.]